MDSTTLVSQSRPLLQRLEALGIPPRMALWVNETEGDDWRLWVVPHPNISRSRDFYAAMAQALPVIGPDAVEPLEISSIRRVSDKDVRLTSTSPFFAIGLNDSPRIVRNSVLGGRVYREVIYVWVEK